MAILNLTQPDQVAVGTTKYEVDWVLIDFKGRRVSIQLVGEHGEMKGFEFVGEDGQTVIGLLSTSDFRTRAMDDAILRRLIAVGLLNGNVV
jgi:hypothetical protein